ncbi:TPA: bifunctional lysylphosphatidylglycerol flippase/synthetase MprF [Enterococcus faecalis]
MKKNISQLTQWLKEHSLLLKLIFLGSVLVFVANQVTHIAQGMTWADIFSTMEQQSTGRLIGMVLAGLLGVIPMLLYDYVVVKLLEKEGKPPMKRMDWLTSAWVTNTINNLAGFGGVVGATLRINFYGKDVPRGKVVATVSKVALFLISGLSILSFVAFVDLFFIRTQNVFREYWVWLLLGSLIAPALWFFTYLKRRTLFKTFFPKAVLLLFGASLGQWLGGMFAFLMIGRLMQVPVSMVSVYPMFVIATLIGMLTMVPGGMGTFDVLMILGLSQLGIDRSQAVVWLLYYRLFYYVTPFMTGVILFLQQAGMKVNQFFDNLPRLFSQKVAHFILVAALYFAGIMMVLLSTVTNLSNVSRLFQVLLPFSFNFLDQTLNLFVGFLLLGLARGISMKVKKAYWPTIILLGFCIVNTVARTTSWQLIAVYAVILLAVILARKEFYREKFVYSWGALTVDSILFGCLFIGYAVAGYYAARPAGGNQVINHFLLFPSDDVWFNGLIGLSISLIGLFFLYQYLAETTVTLGEGFEEARLTRFLEKFGGNEGSQFLYLKDYGHFYYQEEGEDQVLFGFQMKFNKCFVLADPIGQREKWTAATLAFMDQADLLGYQLVFYRISEEYVMNLHDCGFEFMKVGEEGLIQFDEPSTVNQTAWTETVTEKIAAEAADFQFEFYPETISDALYQELERVSADWSRNQKERYFIGGRLDPEYLKCSSVGLVRQKQTVIGFITGKEMEKGKSISYDLLRIHSDVPAFTREYLFTHFIETYQQQGYQLIDIGMAPLSNVGESKYSFLKERFVNIFYKYSYQIYAFQDTRKRKEQYVTSWQPRYFAYPKRTSVLFAFVQLSLLITKGRHQSVSLVEEAMTEI